MLVVKIGGSTLGAHDTTLADLVALQRRGEAVVVVHGGGAAVTGWMDRLGLTARFVRGLRVTDEASLDVVVAVLAGLVNKQLVAEINALGGRAVGISGADGPTLLATVTQPEYGRVGQVHMVQVTAIEALLAAGLLPVLSPVGVEAASGSRVAQPGAQAARSEDATGTQTIAPAGDVTAANAASDDPAGASEESTLPALLLVAADVRPVRSPGDAPGQNGDLAGAAERSSPAQLPEPVPAGGLLNINADTVAGEVAAALGATRLIFLTDVPGVKGEDGAVMASLTPDECTALIGSGAIAGGMIPKVEACLRAAASGAESLIVDGRTPHALLTALGGDTSGTRIRAPIATSTVAAGTRAAAGAGHAAPPADAVQAPPSSTEPPTMRSIS